MCISFFYFTNNLKAKIKSIILFNREEYLKRSAKGMGFHPVDSIGQDTLFFPLDVPTQGTFFCINIKNGNYSFLLNNPLKRINYNTNCKLKRGALPLEFCKLSNDSKTWNAFFENINDYKTEFNGFNLVCGNLNSGVVKYYTNNSEDIKFNLRKVIKDKNDIFSSRISCKDTNMNYERVINPISNKDYEIFDCNKPLELSKNEIYSISNTFLFDGVQRVDFGGILFKDILLKYDKFFNFFPKLENEEIKFDCETTIKNDNINLENNYLNNCRDLEKDFIKELFQNLLENKIKIENNLEEVLKILYRDKNDFENSSVDTYQNSSVFVEDKIENFYTEFGTRNSIALIFDNENKIKIYEYEDVVKEENGYLTNEKRILDKNISLREFIN